MSENTIDDVEIVGMQLRIRQATAEDPHVVILGGEASPGLHFIPQGHTAEGADVMLHGLLVISDDLDISAAAEVLRMIAATLENPDRSVEVGRDA